MATAFGDLGQTRKISRNQVRLLWHCDFWDGPINGLCEFNSRKYWFTLLDDGEPDALDALPRKFALVELSPEQLADEERWHKLFREKVGTHCDLEEPHPEVKPKESHREFYEAHEKRAKPDYSSNAIVGWFEMN